MSDNNTNKKVTDNNEIDLLELFRRIGNALKSGFIAIGRATLISIVFLLKKWLPLGLSIMAGLALSYILKSASPSFYTSDLVIRNNLVQINIKTLRDESGTTAEMIAKINKLHQFCTEGNYNALSEAISMKREAVKQISDIGAYWIIDLSKDGIPDYVDYKGNHNVYDTLNVRMQNSLDIRVKTSSAVNLNLVRDGIINFIQNDSLYQLRNNLRLKQNKELLSRITFDIKQLDSLQKVKYFEETRNMKPANGGQIIFMQEQKTQLVYADIYLLYDKKQKLESDNGLYKGIVTVVSDFSPPTRRENGVSFYAKSMVPIFFFITLLILVIFANRRKLVDLFSKY
jgi:hypothetical protein